MESKQDETRRTDNSQHDDESSNLNLHSEETTPTIWFQQDEQWELTWPIWHMLPRNERKALANKYGYKTIGEFEEYMSLTRAVGDSAIPIVPLQTTEGASAQRPYDNDLLYGTTAVPPVKDKSDEEGKTKSKIRNHHSLSDNYIDDEDDGSVTTTSTRTSLRQSSADTRQADLSEADLLERAGLILVLPEEVLHHLLEYLPLEMYATAARVSPHWRYFTRSEATYKRLCERVYLQQSKRKSLHVDKFGHSYRKMLYSRPRVRAGGGMYVLRFKSVKKIQRDMWTEIPMGAVLETVYYRYLWFQEDGRVLYALTTSPPHEMICRILKVAIKPHLRDKAAVWGKYQVRKNAVTVTAQQAWQTVRFEMTIMPDSIYGRFGALSLDRHRSSYSGKFPEHDESGYTAGQISADIVDYVVPPEKFLFLKDRKL